ncbi:MAG: lyase family protein [Candidatus Omnitrophica bacterium]|nr:lyase family protein [Candidatus Omnitrophota bacterium]MDD5487723.1 lyase family protein [Candidatus Omnitrophota bacterium]
MMSGEERGMPAQMELPEGTLWGEHTERARRNFAVSGMAVNPGLIKAMALVKKACCMTNRELGYIGGDKATAILAACEAIAAGEHAEAFPLDAMQGGAGTSTNMNLNEVISRLASVSCDPGVTIDPIEDVNMHQSTNDVYPTALRVAAITGVRRLSAAIQLLQGALQRKEKELAEVVKTGRTEMQEAVPITLGAEFASFGEAIGRDRWRAFKCEERLRVVNLGGTAVGTGLGAPREYIFLVIERLREATGMGLSRGENLMAQTANADEFVEVSAILKAHACNIIKLSEDLRKMNLLKEISLPALQKGSSIMPGKVNPVMTECAIQVSVAVIANDLMISEAASRGSFEINEFLPLVSHALLGSLDMLAELNARMASYVEGITADKGICRAYMDANPGIITAFVPYIGYNRAEGLVEEYKVSGKACIRVFLEEKLGKKTVDEVLSPYNILSLGYTKNEKNA